MLRTKSQLKQRCWYCQHDIKVFQETQQVCFLQGIKSKSERFHDLADLKPSDMDPTSNVNQVATPDAGSSLELGIGGCWRFQVRFASRKSLWIWGIHQFSRWGLQSLGSMCSAIFFAHVFSLLKRGVFGWHGYYIWVRCQGVVTGCVQRLLKTPKTTFMLCKGYAGPISVGLPAKIKQLTKPLKRQWLMSGVRRWTSKKIGFNICAPATMSVDIIGHSLQLRLMSNG